MAAWRLAEVPAGTFGPHLGSSRAGGIAVWAAREGGSRAWFSAALDEDGKVRTQPARIAGAPDDVGLIVVRGLEERAGGGFIVLCTSRDEGGARLDAIALHPDGRLRGGPTPVVVGQRELMWIELVPTAAGGIVFWAVPGDGQATLSALEIGPDGAARGAEAALVPDARSWQVAPVPGGAVVAAVAGGLPSATGAVVAGFVNERGRMEGRRTVVSSAPNAELDLDLAPAGGALVLAWTERRGPEGRLVAAVLGPKADLQKAPVALGDPFGAQALIRLVPPPPGGDRAYVVWENLLERPAFGRTLRVASVDASATLSQEQAVIDIAAEDGSIPEFSATERGLAALTVAPLCGRGQPCEGAPLARTFVQFDKRLDVVASEPLRLEPLDGDTAPLAWGLACRRFACTAFAAEPETPAPVFVVQLDAVTGAFEPAARKVVPEAPPRVVALEAVAATESVAALGATRTGGTDRLAWVTEFDSNIPYERPKAPAPDGRWAPVRAILRTKTVGTAGDPVVISYRAESLGGAHLVSPGDGAREALLTWTAFEQNVPQVFLTLVGPDGKRLQQRMLTRGPRGAASVSAVSVEGGYLVGWLDERSGRPEPYVARVDKSLRSVFPERLVANTPSGASDLRLQLEGAEVRVVWAESREDRRAELFSTRIAVKDGGTLSPVEQLTRTKEHSHSPVLSRLKGQTVLAWLEEELRVTPDGTSALALQVLEGGAKADAPAVLSLPAPVRSAALACGETRCRVVVRAAARHGLELWGVDFAPGGEPRLGKLVGLGAGAPEVEPVLLGDDVYYADRAADGTVMVRRLRVEWPATP